MEDFEIKPTDVLVLIDIQKDFLPGGSLAVPNGDEIMPEVVKLAREFDNIVLTQDWHPAGHSSFASSYEGKAPFDTTEMPYGTQVLWPDHCVMGSEGANFDLPNWIRHKAQMVIRKGFRPDIDSYSAFMENDKKTPTGLDGYMKSRGLERAVFAGLATDFCVGFSAIDAANLGFESVVFMDACRGIADDTINERVVQMASAGVQII